MKLPRFSLRALLLLTALLAAFCYWRDRPRQIANQFVAAIEAGDLGGARAMFLKDHSGLSSKPRLADGWFTSRQRQTTADWFAGRCFVDVYRQRGGGVIADRVKVSALGVKVVDSRQTKRYWVDASPPSRHSK